MKKFIRSIICGLFGILYIGSINAQNVSSYNLKDPFLNEYVSRSWISADGLPGNAVTDMLFDNSGYLYIGTYDGLVRFDGVEFVTYSRNINPKYDFVSVRALFQDKDGNLWVGHNDEGVSCIYQDGRVVRFSTNEGLPNNSVRSICQDKDGNIWLGTSSGICYLDSKNEFHVPNGITELHQEHIQVSRLFCDTAGRIWISTAKENELLVYTNNTVQYYSDFGKIKNPAVYEISQDKTGALWFGVSPNLAVRVRENEETVFNVGQPNKNTTIVNTIFQDRNANIWFGTDNGLAVLHEGKMSYLNKSNGLNDEKITKITEDREGNIWISTDRGGITKLSQSKFRTNILGTTVNAICEDTSRDVIWIGSDDGLYCLKDNKFIENNITSYCKGMRVRHVELTNDKELLISTYAKNGQICVKPNGTIINWNDTTGIPAYKCRVAIKTSKGDYYIGTTEGLGIIDGNSGKVTKITKVDGIDNEYIMAIYEDDDNNIWIGTDGGGVYILKDKVIVKKYTTENGLAGNVIFKISKIADSGIWITTGTGVSKYIAESDSFYSFNSGNGLGTDGVFQMICDYTHTIWMTSNRGILSVKLKDFENVISGTQGTVNARYYGKSDGLSTAGITSTSVSCTDSIGRIWFTLIDGFAVYNPVQAGKNAVPPKVHIQEFVIDNEVYQYYGQTIVLKPSAKRLDIKYTGLSFNSSDQLRFSYVLEGFENNYSQWTKLRTVSYTNLKPGTYKFSLISQNADEYTSEPCPPVTIIKKPYIWQTYWFWLVLFLLVASTTIFGVQIKIYSMKRTQKELENKVEERTHDLKLEKEKSEKLLLNILPEPVAKELTEHPNQIIAKKFPKATVLFTDIVGFTQMSDGLNAEEIVTMLNRMISKFDERAKVEGIEKIKTIGDAYMAATGLTEDPNNDGAKKMIRFAKGLIWDVYKFNEDSPIKIKIRLGINTGNLVAGVIGKSKFIYDVWGDTVNVASRMESTGEPMKIHVTESTYQETKEFCTYSEGIEVEVKGKGTMKTYFL